MTFLPRLLKVSVMQILYCAEKLASVFKNIYVCFREQVTNFIKYSFCQAFKKY